MKRVFGVDVGFVSQLRKKNKELWKLCNYGFINITELHNNNKL